MNITELLHTALEIDPEHICLNITTITNLYTLCFIQYEDETKIGVYITGDDGRERFMILPKKYITALQVVYKQDIILNPMTNDMDVMIQ